MNNKEKYIKSVDNLKADEFLKAKTIKSLKSKPSTPYRTLVNVAVTAVFVFSCVWVVATQGQKGELERYQISDTVELAQGIKTVENMEQLKQLIKERNVPNASWDDTKESSVMQDFAYNATEATTKRFSSTNIQVEGVDEADIVKTDGEYIYYAGDAKKIKIVDVKEQKLVSEIELYEEDEEGGAQQIYINNNKLIVISSRYITYTATAFKSRVVDLANVTGKRETEIHIYNVADKTNIVKEQSVSLTGNHLNSRMIGDFVYVITNQYIYQNDEIKETDLLPCYTKNDVKTYVPYEYIYYEEENKNNSYINIMSINMQGETQVKSFLGSGSQVYVSEKSIYITKTKYNETVNEKLGIASITIGDAKTQIYKFSIDKGEIALKEATDAPGSLLNQFSMDEYNGYFRIATTLTKDNTRTNNLYIYDARMNKVGELTNIAPNESIYSVRFMGEKAYIVTFEQVDPLFVIDLSSPKEPKILGELKVPGFSNYLHIYDETHLIGIGQNTVTDAKGNVQTKGVKVSLFDVSNPVEPKELSNIVLGDKGAYSTALYNHKAVLFIKEKGILAFPLTIYKEGKNGKYFNGIEVLQISLENGVQEKGKIGEETTEKFVEALDRVIYIEDNLYSINYKQILINNIDTLQEINRVNF